MASHLTLSLVASFALGYLSSKASMMGLLAAMSAEVVPTLELI